MAERFINQTRAHRKRRMAVARAKGFGPGASAFYGTKLSAVIEHNLLTNGKFSADTAGWTATGSTLASIAGGQEGNSLRVTNSGAASGYASQQLTCPAGTYTLTLYYKNGTGPCKITVATTKGGTDIASQTVTNAAWTAITITFTAAGANPWINVFVNDTTSGHTAFFDEIVVWPVQ